MRWLSLLLLCLPACTAQAGSYNYRNDSYAWESAASKISWDGSCTAAGNDDDQATVNFSGGFTFPFNGSNYSSRRVLLDGMVQFGPDTGLQRIAGPAALPIGTAPASGGCAAGATGNTLMVYWRDFQLTPILLLFPSGGSVSWEQKGAAPNRRVVVSWNDVYVPAFSLLGIVISVNRYNFQLILYENGEFKYQYQDSNPDGSDATIGVQLGSSDTTLYGYKRGFNAPGSAVRWFPGNVVPAPLASYSFDESSYDGTSGEIKDGSGNKHPATVVGVASSDALGQSCRSLLVPANTGKTGDGADTALDPNTQIGSAGGIDFFYRPAAAWGAKDAMLVDGTSNTQRPFYLMMTANGEIRFAITDSGNTVRTATTPKLSVAADAWVHVAVSWDLRSGTDLSVLRIWINGEQQAVSLPQTGNATLNKLTAALRIGDAQTSSAASGGTLNSANGRIDELHLYQTAIGSSEVGQDYAASHSCASALHHLLISGSSNQGVSCAAASFTLKACADAACASLVTTGVTGALSGSNAATLWPGGTGFSIPAGQGSASFAMQLPVAGSTALGASSSVPLAQAATRCDFDAACRFTSSASALLLSVPNHTAASAGVKLTLSAIRSSADNTRCLPAFAGVSRSVRLSCSYANPGTGTLWPSIGGGSCNAAGSTVSASFNASGDASLPFSYADVGQLGINASYAGSAANGDAGLAMSGSTAVIAAPASFSLGGIGSPLVAGVAFDIKVSALNANAIRTPNFMQEAVPATPSLGFVRSSPVGVGASDGSFSGSIRSAESGVMTGSAAWSEVGQGTLSASISDYLGSGLGATGSTTAGSFVPHHFDVATTPACGSFSYAGQPFAIKVTARNGLASPGTTLNYDGSGALAPAYAQAGSYSAAQAIGAGAFSPATLPARAFDHGVATVDALSYAFTSKLTAPGALFVRVVDGNEVSSAGGSEGSVLLRSGRLRLSSNSGAENAPLALPVEAQYWSGAAWVRNSADSCTAVPASAVLRFNPLTLKGLASLAMSNTAGGFALVNGQASVLVSAASPAAAGTLDIGLNLGNSSAAQLCTLAALPLSTGANLPWLRSQNGGLGACGLAWNRDPAARATFGVIGAESNKVIDARIPY